jgi:predicted nucleic acid-binding protein
VTIAGLLRAHARIGLDSNVFIYLFEGRPPEADLASALVDGIAGGSATGTLAMLGLTEILTGPARAYDVALVERYAEELVALEGLTIPGYGRELAVEAAIVRGAAPSMTLGDAIHLASARLEGATVFVTNDHRLKRIDRLGIAYLDELTTA